MNLSNILSEAEDFAADQLDQAAEFWLKHCPNHRAGGYLTCLDRQGRPYSDVKPCMWSHGRIAWTFAKLYREWKQNDDYLALARHGVEYAQAHGFDEQGRAYYAIDAKNTPMQYDPTMYCALSYVVGFAQYTLASGETEWAERARTLFDNAWERMNDPRDSCQYFGGLYPLRLHGYAMVTLNVLQELRELQGPADVKDNIDRCISQMLDLHTFPDEQATYELVTWDGGKAPGHLGRWINPGHMIEGGIFLIHEGLYRNDDALQQRGLALIDWGWDRGWDNEYGGLYNDMDSEQTPLAEHACRGPMKLWWQHAEAYYGLLLAAAVSQGERFVERWRLLKKYIEDHFVDREFGGDWFAIISREGNLLDPSKGSPRKNLYHVGRNLVWTLQLRQRMKLDKT